MKDLQCSVVVPIVYDATEDVSVAIGRHGLKEIASDNLAARRDLRGTERLCTGDHMGLSTRMSIPAIVHRIA